MPRMAFKPQVVEGNSGCVAWTSEFGLEAGGATRENALYSLLRLIVSHCQAVVATPHDVDIPSEDHQLAAAVVKYGAVLEVEIDHEKLAEMLEKIPHLGPSFVPRQVVTSHRWLDQGFVGGKEEICKDLAGHCAFKNMIAMLRATATTTGIT